MENITDVSPLDAILRSPLYQEFSFEDGEAGSKALFNFFYFSGKLDWLCPDCQKNTTYEGQPNYPDDPKQTSGYYKPKLSYFSAFSEHYDLGHFYNGRYFRVSLRCLRGDRHSEGHLIEVWFKVQKNVIIKMGQYPSATTIEQYEYGRYRKVLGQKYSEFNRAIGLFNHNVGIGSFVYLRRIFEDLIRQASKAHPELVPSGFETMRMDEKINALKRVLPKYLVEKRKLYSILSKGVHDLSEDQCLKYFPAVRLGIELMLDEKLERLIREEKTQANSKDIDALHAELEKQ